jgi:hypothetical protein
MREALTFADLLQRWQQRDDDEVLVATDLLASDLAQAVERAATVAYQARLEVLALARVKALGLVQEAQS